MGNKGRDGMGVGSTMTLNRVERLQLNLWVVGVMWGRAL